MWTLIMMPVVQGVRLQDYVLILCTALKYHQNMLQRCSVYWGFGGGEALLGASHDWHGTQHAPPAEDPGTSLQTNGI